MITTAKPMLPSLIALSLLALFAFGPNAAAQQNYFEGFTKAPTFTPPVGCVPRMRNYGVLSRCEKTIEPGRTLVVLINTSVGWFPRGAAGIDEFFVTDHVAEIKAYWEEWYPRNNLAFSSKASDVAPRNAPRQGTSCIEYSITVESSKTIDQQPLRVLERREGLTCAWRVDEAAAGKPNVELFWLEAFYEYAPSIGQKPIEAFDLMIRDLFESVRL